MKQKKRKDAIEIYEKSLSLSLSVQEKVDREKRELEILQEYLPEEMSDEELEKLVADAIQKTDAGTMADIGKVMGMVMGVVKGRAGGSRVSETVKKKLTS